MHIAPKMRLGRQVRGRAEPRTCALARRRASPAPVSRPGKKAAQMGRSRQCFPASSRNTRSVSADGRQSAAEPGRRRVRVRVVTEARSRFAIGARRRRAGVNGCGSSGDTRFLYLGWLLSVQSDDVADDEIEPPVSPGLADLDGPLQEVAAFLRVDENLLAVAALDSPDLAGAQQAGVELATWIGQLTAAERTQCCCGRLRARP